MSVYRNITVQLTKQCSWFEIRVPAHLNSLRSQKWCPISLRLQAFAGYFVP